MPPQTINMVKGGETITVTTDQLATAVERGFVPESAEQRAGRIEQAAKEDIYGGVGMGLAAGGARALGAGTFGLSDAIISELGGGDVLADLQEYRPGASLVGNLTGALAPGAVGGKALAWLPSARASRIASEVTALGEGAGLATRAGYAAAGAGVEGALQNAGAYITDVALGNRELSGEGFMGAMGKGALWGGVAGGALTLGSGALTAARRMFPRTEMTAANVAKVEREAVDEVLASLDDSASLQGAARERLSQIRTERSIQDPAIAAKMDEIKAAKQREIYARAETATAKAERAEAQAAKAKAAAERAKQPNAPRSKAAKIADAELDAAAAVDDVAKVADDVTEDATTLLERQLLGTKATLDAGGTLADAAAKRPTTIGLEDALNAEIAKVDPEAARLVHALDEAKQSGDAVAGWLQKYGKGGNVGKFERSSAARDYAEGMRSKGPGWVTKVPEGEGNVVIRRGREMQWRGTDAERLASEGAITSKVTPAERAAADAAVDAKYGARRAAEAPKEAAEEIAGEASAKEIAEEVVSPTPDAPPIESLLDEVISKRVDDIADDINDSATTIGRHEAASAELADALGPMAPTRAQERAKMLRDAQRSADDRTAQAAANVAEDLERAAATGTTQTAVREGGAALGKAQDVGTAWEALHMMGVPLPDPRDIPVIGPVLSMYLKARVLGKAFGRFGGKVSETAETAIATKAAQTKERVIRAVDALLEGTSKAMAKVAPKSGGTAAVLGHVLFDDRPSREAKPYSSEPRGGGKLEELYQARADELARAMVPGAVRAAVRDRVRASDPAIVDAIVAAKERKLQFLHDKMPKQDVPSLFHQAPAIGKVQLAQWARYIEAAEDPAGVLERAAAGQSVTMEAAETLKTVYPQMFAAAQQRLVEQMISGTSEIPYKRRVHLSLLFEVPLGDSMTPEYTAFLQDTYKAQGQAAPAGAPMAPGPPQPTVSAPVNVGSAYDPYTR